MLLKKNNVQTSSKITALQNSANIDWSDLVKKDRVKNIKNLIKEMGEHNEKSNHRP